MEIEEQNKEGQEEQTQKEEVFESSKKKTIPTRLGLLIVLLVAVIAAVGVQWYADSYTPEVADVSEVVEQMQERRTVEELRTLSFYEVRENGVYYKDELMEGVDMKSFTLIQEYEGVAVYGEMAQDAYNTYYHGKVVVEESVFSKLRLIDSNYYKDEYNVYRLMVYYGDRTRPTSIPVILSDLDVESFEYLGFCMRVGRRSDQVESFVKDKRSVYCGEKKIKDADPATFKIVNSPWAKDKEHVYQAWRLMENINPADCTADDLDGCNSLTMQALLPGHEIIGNKMYYNGELIEEADPETFVVITDPEYRRNNYWYAKDKNNVYVYESTFSNNERVKVIEGADPETFEFTEDYCSSSDSHIFHYAKDKDSVFCWMTELEGADPETFEAVGYSSNYYGGSALVIDKNNLYFGSTKIKNIDRNSLEIIKESGNGNRARFLKDKNNVYFLTFSLEEGELNVFEQADVLTFEYLGSDYSKDKNHVYWSSGIIEDANPENFEILSERYSRDKVNVYYAKELINGADPETFVNIKNYYTKDKNHVYYRSEIMEDYDVATFEIFGHYNKDKNHVYYNEKIIDGADPRTFIELKHHYAKDKNYAYNQGEIIKGVDPATCTKENLCYKAPTE